MRLTEAAWTHTARRKHLPRKNSGHLEMPILTWILRHVSITHPLSHEYSHYHSTLVNPPFLYGPFAEGFTLPTPNYYALSTNLYIYRLLTPAGTFPTSPAHADVRDVATAHVLALTSPPASSVSRKRILFASPYGFNFKAVVDLIREKRPELKDRLIKASAPEFPVDKLPIDFGRIEQVLGFGKDDFSAVEDTMLSAVDGLLTIERQWASQGHEVSIPAA